MLFAKGLSILFSLFAGLESAKGALYHFVCGKGKDRAFPYLKEIKQYIKEDVLFNLKSVRTLEIGTKVGLLVLVKTGSNWKEDLFYSVGGFTINAEIKLDGVYLHLEDYYDWHSNKDWDYAWTIPKEFLEKFPSFFLTLGKRFLFPSVEKDGSWTIQEIHLNSLGQSYWHKGTIFYSWQELGVDLSYAVGKIGKNWKYDSFEYTFKDENNLDIITCPNHNKLDLEDINHLLDLDLGDINDSLDIDLGDINIF
jgi:hypothetical protein